MKLNEFFRRHRMASFDTSQKRATTSDQAISAWTREMPDLTDTNKQSRMTRFLTEKKVYPTSWSSEREKEAGLYPDVEDPEFPRKLYYKKEFHDAKAEAFSSLQQKGDQCSLAAFEAFTLTPVQRLVSRFLHPSTPYNGLLLYHGVGVGKTCSAISIAENFLAERPNQRVHIVVPRSIAEGFKNTIFNSKVLRRAKEDDPARYVKSGWYSAQCTGTTYLSLAEVTADEDESRIIGRIKQLKKKRYRIGGYMAFKLAVDKLYKQIPSSITNPEIIKEKRREILRYHFNNGLLIIDEAHNLRQDPKTMSAEEIAPDENPDQDAMQDGAEAKAIVPLLLDILLYCEGLRLVLMTATPMFNTAPEILFLLNLLVLNDTKKLEDLKSDGIFDSKGILKKEAEPEIQKIAGRYVSYMRGENPFTFPVRLFPQEAEESGKLPYPQKTALAKGGYIDIRADVLEGIKALPIHRIKPIPGSPVDKISRLQMDIEAAEGYEDDEEEQTQVGRAKNVLDSWTQISNLTYKDESYGKKGWEAHFGKPTKNITWLKEDYTVDDVFGEGVLPYHAPKIAKILEFIRTSRGINFVYSRYVQPGSLPVCIALERAGYTRVDHTGEQISLLKGSSPVVKQCALCSRKQHGPMPDCPVFKQANYVLLTSDYTVNLPETVNYATAFESKEDIRGGKVKVIIGSMIASEGLDLKCVREIHVLDPWYHLNRIEQILGRGVRYCSHSLLPAEERNCLIRLYTMYYEDYETSDMYSYRLAVQKAKAIGLVQRQLKIGAWDCNLNYQGILLTGDIKQRHIDSQGKDLGEIMLADKANSSMCDYMECSYRCRLDVTPVGELDTSTFTVRDARSYMLLRESALRQMFSISPFWPLSQIRELYTGIPSDVLSAALPTIINNPSFQLKFGGKSGYLILRNDYVIFQPKDITETSIPMALRYKKSAELIKDTPLWMSRLRPAIGPFAKPGVDTTVLVRARPTESLAGVTVLAEDSVSVSPASTASSSQATYTAEEAMQTQEKQMENPANWLKAILKALQATEPQTLQLTSDLKMKMKGLEDLGTIAHHFRNIPQTKEVLLAFGLEHFYGNETIRKLHNLVVKDALTMEPLNEYQTVLKHNMFQDETIKGYFILSPDGKTVISYCSRGTAEIIQCPSNLQTYVEIAAKISGLESIREVSSICGKLFGMLVWKTSSSSLTFKTVENTPAGAETDGAECTGVSNKEPHLRKIMKLREEAEKFDKSLFEIMYPLTIMKEEAGSKRSGQRRRFIEETIDMKQSTLCIYLEFLCRLMDARRVGGKRWFMNSIEFRRSYDAPGSQWPKKK
jgi:hypothetical protein